MAYLVTLCASKHQYLSMPVHMSLHSLAPAQTSSFRYRSQASGHCRRIPIEFIDFGSPTFSLNAPFAYICGEMSWHSLILCTALIGACVHLCAVKLFCQQVTGS